MLLVKGGEYLRTLENLETYLIRQKRETRPSCFSSQCCFYGTSFFLNRISFHFTDREPITIMYSSIFFLEKKFLRRPFCNLGNGKMLVSVMTVSSLSTTHYAYYCFPLAVESLELFWSQTPPPAAPRSPPPPPPPPLPFGRMLKYYFFVVVCCLMM